jgi:copper transport protein
MSRRWAITVTIVAAALALALPVAASAHAYLIKTVPAASGVLTHPPATVQLTYDEAVEPKFAIISVTNVQGQQVTTAPVARSPADPDTLTVPLRPDLPEGWYLIYWRAISVDGHPVQGAFTYAVGPSPGPAPQFRIPSIASSATRAQLLITRWLMFLGVMVSIGLFVLRMLIARPVVRRVPGVRVRALSVGFVVSSVLGLIAIPVYLDFSIANDSLRSVFDLGTLVPLYRVTAFGRAFVDLELCFALFCLAAWIALWLDRPARDRRSVAEIAATFGALAAAAAALVIPGTAGHAAQTSPRGLTLFFDWVHMGAGSIWLGGLIGLLVLWLSVPGEWRVAALRASVPRFSSAALGSVIVLGASGIGESLEHLPAVNALWETGFGRAILVKAGLLVAALAIASGNLLRSRPHLIASDRDPDAGTPAAALLRRLVSGEAVVVLGIVFTAAILTSLAPPPPAFALENSAIAKVGPGRVLQTVNRAGYQLQVVVSPNRAAAPDSFALRITKDGQPVTGANVTLTFNHLQMQMPQQQYQLTEIQPGVYARNAPALVMVGRWSLDFQITPRNGQPFSALIVDQANG